MRCMDEIESGQEIGHGVKIRKIEAWRYSKVMLQVRLCNAIAFEGKIQLLVNIWWADIIFYFFFPFWKIK
uniref:Uncharacterized protein n=1 Tax=Arundo donax TaxID=35708 RepID=A0A0A9EPP9_ARUDO